LIENKNNILNIHALIFSSLADVQQIFSNNAVFPEPWLPQTSNPPWTKNKIILLILIKNYFYNYIILILYDCGGSYLVYVFVFLIFHILNYS